MNEVPLIDPHQEVIGENLTDEQRYDALKKALLESAAALTAIANGDKKVAAVVTAVVMEDSPSEVDMTGDVRACAFGAHQLVTALGTMAKNTDPKLVNHPPVMVALHLMSQVAALVAMDESGEAGEQPKETLQ